MPTSTEPGAPDHPVVTDTPIYDDLALAVPGFADLPRGLPGVGPQWSTPATDE